MSGEQPAARSPFSYASDYDAAPYSSDQDPTVNERAIPLITPMQRYMLEGLDKMWKAQTETNAQLAGMRKTLDDMAPRLVQLEQQAAWWQKAVSVAKYALPAIVMQLAPSLAKYTQVIIDALGKAQ